MTVYYVHMMVFTEKKYCKKAQINDSPIILLVFDKHYQGKQIDAIK